MKEKKLRLGRRQGGWYIGKGMERYEGLKREKDEVFPKTRWWGALESTKERQLLSRKVIRINLYSGHDPIEKRERRKGDEGPGAKGF